MFSENVDCPPDEYEYEAEEILRHWKPGDSIQTTVTLVSIVFRDALGEEELSQPRLREAGAEVHKLLIHFTRDS